MQHPAELSVNAVPRQPKDRVRALLSILPCPTATLAIHRSPTTPPFPACTTVTLAPPFITEPAAEFWDNLLRDKFSTQQEAAAATLGRGARERGKVHAHKGGGVEGTERGGSKCLRTEGWRGARVRGGGRGGGRRQVPVSGGAAG